MALILCIETTTTQCSVALANNGELVAIKQVNAQNYTHAETLHPFIDEVVMKAGIKFKDLSAVAVSEGPGSYTGLRIGVSAAKGLCYALDIPLIATQTLHTLALQYKQSFSFIVPMLDARRMEVYAAIYNNNNNFNSVLTPQPIILSQSSFTEQLETGTVVFIGNGAQKFKSICTHPNAIFVENAWPSAQEMIGVAHTKFTNQQFENLAYFEPLYLKEVKIG